MANREYVTALVQSVIARSLAAGAAGSDPYNAVYNPAVAALLASAVAVNARILTQDGGKIVTDVSIPGQSVRWATQMTLTEQMLSLMEAWNMLQGNVTIIRRSVARHF